MNPIPLLQQLIRFETVNPPGDEAACIGYLADLLSQVGIEPLLLESTPGRPNLIARLKGTGQAPPLLLQGHVDVVPVAGQPWSFAPFAGDLADGYIRGRGALDMKGGVAMFVSAVLRAQAERLPLPGDVILCLLADEEASGTHGARFLVEQHAEVFRGVRFALGEFGGFNTTIAGARFYPIQVAEKQACLLHLTCRGPGGHAASPVRGGAMAKLGAALTALDQARLPVHLTPPAQAMLQAVAARLSPPADAIFASLLDPAQTDPTLEALGAVGQTLGPLLHNTVSPTLLMGSPASNVIPSEVTVTLDGRVLPGLPFETLLTEIAAVVGPGVELHLEPNEPTCHPYDPGLFEVLAGILRAADPSGTPIPYLLPAVTDGRYFARLGIQTYGFTPLQLPEGFDFTASVHAADERVPADAITFGAEMVYQALSRFGNGG
jgi:acetylornithine deacetylase/succinyl-diaminopimelate desuccinylase-like protein